MDKGTFKPLKSLGEGGIFPIILQRELEIILGSLKSGKGQRSLGINTKGVGTGKSDLYCKSVRT